MSYFEDTYLNRLNRYGNNYSERILTQRREVFKRRLFKSVYRIDFEFKHEIYPATFERFKQDNTEVMRYLFTEYDLIIPNGTVLMLPDPIEKIPNAHQPFEVDFPEYAGNKPIHDEYEDAQLRPWMVYYLEDSGAKGYNRYVMLKMTHMLHWLDRDKKRRESYAYMYGQEDNMLKDEFQGRSKMDARYTENLKMSFFVMPANSHLRKDDYFIIDKKINHKVLEEYYRVTGYDIQSQDGVEYVTVDPIYEHSSDYRDEDKDTFWLTGGNN